MSDSITPEGSTMHRLLYIFATNLIASAFGMLLAHVFLGPTVLVRIYGFLTAVVVFTVVQTILTPIITRTVREHSALVLATVGLFSTFLSLMIATLFPGGIRIYGRGWLSATLLPWAVTAIGNWLAVNGYLERHLRNRNKE